MHAQILTLSGHSELLVIALLRTLPTHFFPTPFLSWMGFGLGELMVRERKCESQRPSSACDVDGDAYTTNLSTLR